ncbi:MAG: HDOD domain-containing protein [Desulfobulbus sp.]|nr:HDOD domain-containing protein [Desulfobulbus sp.]
MANQQAFVETLRTFLESERLTLPVFNPITLRVQQELVKKEPNFSKVEKLIRADQSLSSNIVNIANSALYRGLLPVNTVKAAIVRLGISEVARIAFTDINKKIFTCRDSQIDSVMKKLWQHSLGCAFAAGMLSQRLDFGVMQHEAFSAGLFHDIGKLLILKVLAKKKRNNKGLVVPEDILLGAMDLLHTEQGDHLLRQIQMPEFFAVIARDHHMEDYDRDNYLLLLVRMANYICHALGIGLKEELPIPLLRQPEALQLRLAHSDLEKIEKFLQTTPGLFD